MYDFADIEEKELEKRLIRLIHASEGMKKLLFDADVDFGDCPSVAEWHEAIRAAKGEKECEA